MQADSDENCAILVEKMNEANESYSKRAAGKGKAHPDGARRTTLTGALMLLISEANFSEPDVAARAAEMNKVLEAVGRLSLERQHSGMKTLMKLYTTPEQFEPMIQECEWRKVKKGDKYLLRLQVAPAHPLHSLMDVVHFVIETLTDERRDGPPPRGPAWRRKKGEDQDL